MSKRTHTAAFDNAECDVKVPAGKKDVNKHSLDSDEEDSGAEEERNNVMHADDIEGEEEGVGGMEGEITITPFNMKEEMEEGHFDTQGHYHWKKEKEVKDGWLDNIDWVKVKGRPEDKYKIHKDDSMKGLGDESSSDSDEEEEKKFNLTDNYKVMLSLMQPKETVTKALQRLGGNNARLSSAERWKRKKAGIVDEGAAKVTQLTELANEILTNTGNMDVYQENYEKIAAMVDKATGKTSDKKEAPELDMYADDFDDKEKHKKKEPVAGSSNSNEPENGVTIEQEDNETKWEFKWSQDGGSPIQGPHSTEQMHKWSTEGYFKTGVWVRRFGQEGQFYTSNRIDFELYL